MQEFKIEKITERITRIQGPCGEFMYLIEGQEKAALVDTGSGIGSLKRVVRQITDKKIIVIITHGHADHAGGAAEFDTVYMNYKDRYVYNEHSRREFRMNEILRFPLKNDLKKADYIESLPMNCFLPLEDGNVFDLGDCRLHCMACPGHTKGSMVALIPEERIMLTGDAANDATFLFEWYSTSVEVYKKSIENLLRQVTGKYDRVLTCHHSGEVAQEILEGVLDVCDDILCGNCDDMPLPIHGKEDGLFAKAITGPSMERADGGVGNIVYNKAHIFDK